jgi:hypothetical protein
MRRRTMPTNDDNVMEQWEYWTGILRANAEEQREFLQKQRWPNGNPPKHAPQAMIPELNKFGEKGWELVHMEPVPAGKNLDIAFGGGAGFAYSNAYFCVFKRRKRN